MTEENEAEQGRQVAYAEDLRNQAEAANRRQTEFLGTLVQRSPVRTGTRHRPGGLRAGRSPCAGTQTENDRCWSKCLFTPIGFR